MPDPVTPWQPFYESRGAGRLIARTLVQTAHTLAGIDPARALAVVDQALPMLLAEDVSLRCHAENIRTDCMIDLGEVDLALQTFDAAEPIGAGRRRSRGAAASSRRRNFSNASATTTRRCSSALSEVRQFLKTHWKIPAATPPRFFFQ